ncbi:hypothetical protein CF392_10685 [Tamilnaduibacter salinus]|uniref:Transcriptional regulator AbiEi antitoxin N-terminal domain-containing protein n=1 Tax=Tamilnaduibacter salinus TaxID=1484056 RepID=A0A2A2I0E6_9GAMM|nr:type IV toxin-antitoxin system AbiEi family antitoxin domain-containing protein [Tamilnaduibacter salinus]PAV25491.1 hypothetical protein CF392_10685 [Tamilnaduibacter salinus]
MSKGFDRSLADLVDYGQLRTRQWLVEHGVSRHSLDNALKSGKLVPLARGVVARPGVSVGWQGVVASLDRMHSEPVYIGGLSALSEAGLGHYVDFSGSIHLYSSAPEPPWLKRLELDMNLVWHGTTRLWGPEGAPADSLKEVSENHFAYWVASPEVAFLEVLAEVPDTVSFEHADNLMQGLSALSPKRLDAVLRVCRHVQVKRLFFFFADRYRYPWRKRLSSDDYDLGRGKRRVETGGKLDRTYWITVPEAFHGSE